MKNMEVYVDVDLTFLVLLRDSVKQSFGVA